MGVYEPFCANCVDGTIGLETVDFDGKDVLMCYRCREEHPKLGGYNFNSEIDRFIKPIYGKAKLGTGRKR